MMNAIVPGPVTTELFLTGKPEELIQRLTSDIPLGRLGQSEDIAGVVSFLASAESARVNGRVIEVNGGGIEVGGEVFGGVGIVGDAGFGGGKRNTRPHLPASSLTVPLANSGFMVQNAVSVDTGTTSGF